MALLIVPLTIIGSERLNEGHHSRARGKGKSRVSKKRKFFQPCNVCYRPLL
jgi:hypothetical protein